MSAIGTIVNEDHLPVFESAAAMGAEVSTAIGCSEASEASDMLQSPYEVAVISCGNVGTAGVNLYVFDNPSEKSFALSDAIEMRGPAFGYLVGIDWVVIGPPETVRILSPKLGGQAYEDVDLAAADNPAPAKMEELTTCQQFATAAVIDYVANNSDAVHQVDSIMPGLEEYFNSVLRPKVQGLAALGSGDPGLAADELIPLAPDFRTGCRMLVQ